MFGWTTIYQLGTDTMDIDGVGFSAWQHLRHHLKPCSIISTWLELTTVMEIISSGRSRAWAKRDFHLASTKRRGDVADRMYLGNWPIHSHLQTDGERPGSVEPVDCANDKKAQKKPFDRQNADTPIGFFSSMAILQYEHMMISQWTLDMTL